MSAVTVVGLGKLGAVLAAVLAERGHTVIGVDINELLVKNVNDGIPPIRETGIGELYNRVRPDLSATTDMKVAVGQSSIAFVVVPTPSQEDGSFSNQYVIEAVEAIGEALQDKGEWFTVVICSTVMPGSCGGPIKEALERSSGRTVGETVGLAHSPEFIALGSVIHDMTHPDMVLLGADDDKSRQSLFEIITTVPRTMPAYRPLSLVDAELAKIGLNCYVTMKMSYANMIGEICSNIPGADAANVLSAIGNDSRVGARYLRSGAAWGGPCYPRDTLAFGRMAENVGVEAYLVGASSQINKRQLTRLINQLVVEDKVSILGLSYKPNTHITERSFGVDLATVLMSEGVFVSMYDPEASTFSFNGRSCELTVTDCIAASPVIVVATPWPEFATLDYQGKKVIDLWGIVPDGPNVERFGKGAHL